MNEKFDESSFNEAAITDVETARLALRWALDKIHAQAEEDMKSRQNLQEKSSQVAFLENQLKSRNSELERAQRSHDEEITSRQDSLENQFRSRLERIAERETELEDKISKHEEQMKQKEAHLLDDYQKKSEELRARWAQVEGELWQLRQEQLAKQQEFERVYGARLEDEKKKLSEELASQKASLEHTYQNRVEDLENRERSTGEELKKQEAMLKWAKDSWQKDAEDRERSLKRKDLEVDKKILEKNQEIDDYKVKLLLLDKQLKELPEAVRRRDEDLSRYKDALKSLEGVIGTLETEKKAQQADYEGRLAKMETVVEAERNRYREIETEIPRRLKIAVEHERNRLAEKLQEIEGNYKEDLGKRQEEIEYLQRNLKTFEETIKSMQGDREILSQKVEQSQAQYNSKLEEVAFRERQLQSEYDVRLKVEMEKHTRDLRAEMEAANRLYEDSLRLKLEEITHLRRELDEVAHDRAAGRETVAGLRRDMDAAAERHVSEVAAVKLKLKTEYEQHAAVEAVEAAKILAAERQKFTEMLDEKTFNASAALTRKEEAVSQLKMALQKSGEELKLALAEEKARSVAAIEDNAARSADTLKLREDKIAELSRTLESSRIEREELLLLERQRLERLYAEKEKAMDAEAAAKDAELLRVRESLVKIAAEKEMLAAGFAPEKQALEEKIASLSTRLTEEEATASLKVDNAVRREVDRYSEIIDRKNHELEALSRVRQAQEDGYRTTLEDFREKLADALGRFEVLKKTAEDRQLQVSSLQLDLAREKKTAENSISHLSARLAARETDYKYLRTEYEDFKAAFEEDVKAEEKKFEEAMHRLRAVEEQKASRDKQIEALKRDGELLRLELVRRDHEQAEMKTSSAKALEAERKELRAANERLSQEFAQKEKSMTAEISVFRAEAGANEIAAEKFHAQAEEYGRNIERLKTVLEEERARKLESEKEGQLAREAYEGRIKELFGREEAQAAELLSVKHALAEKAERFSEQGSETEALRQAAERLRAALEGERKKRMESELAAETALSGARAKEKELLERLSRELAQKEKDVMVQIEEYKKAAETKDLSAEKYKIQAEDAARAADRIRDVLETERARQAEKDAALRREYDMQLAEVIGRESAVSAELLSLKQALSVTSEEAQKGKADSQNLRAELERLRPAFEEEKKKRSEAEAAALVSGSALREKSAESSGRYSELETLNRSVDRLKLSLDEERKKRVEAEAAALVSGSALREKTAESSGQHSELQTLSRSVERLTASLEEERKKRAGAEAAAENSSLELRKKSEEESAHRSEIEALRYAVDRIKAAFSEEQKKRAEVELLAETSHSELHERAEQLSSQKSEADGLKNTVDRLKAALEDEKRKRTEAELAAVTSHSALLERTEQISGQKSETEGLKNAVDRLKAVLEGERKKRMESELAAETALSVARAKEKELLERLSRELAQKEKDVMSQVEDYKKAAETKDLSAEKYKIQAEDAARAADRIRDVLETERARQAEKDAALRREYDAQLADVIGRESAVSAELLSLKQALSASTEEAQKGKADSQNLRAALERLQPAFEEEKKKRSEAEAAALASDAFLREKTAESSGRYSELETLNRSVDRLKLTLDEERKKRVEAEAAALISGSALREKTAESSGQHSELQTLSRSVERLTASLEEERKKRAGAEAAAENSSLELRKKSAEESAHRSEIEALRYAVDRIKAAFSEEQKKRAEVELLAETSHSELHERAEQLSGQKSETEGLKNAVDRLKAALEDEKRKRTEAELAAVTSRSVLNEKTEEITVRGSEIEALKHSIERLKHAFEEEHTRRVEAELLSETANSALRERQEEFIRTQKLVEQLKDRLRLWKSK